MRRKRVWYWIAGLKFKIQPCGRHPVLFDIPVLPRHWCVFSHVIFPFEIQPSIPTRSRCQINFPRWFLINKKWQHTVSTCVTSHCLHFSNNFFSQVVWFKNDNTRLSTSDEIYIEDSKVIQLFATPANKFGRAKRNPFEGFMSFFWPCFFFAGRKI